MTRPTTRVIQIMPAPAGTIAEYVSDPYQTDQGYGYYYKHHRPTMVALMAARSDWAVVPVTMDGSIDDNYRLTEDPCAEVTRGQECPGHFEIVSSPAKVAA